MTKRKLAELLFEVYGDIEFDERAMRKYAFFAEKVKFEYEKMYRLGCEEMMKLNNTEEHLWINLMNRMG